VIGAWRLPGFGKAAIDRARIRGDDRPRRSLAGCTDAAREVLSRLPGAPRSRQTSDFFYWSLAEFGLKPVFRINHVVVHGTGRKSGLLHLVAVKQLYASHYFRAAFEVRAVVGDGRPSGKGVYLVMLNMARSDALTGVLGGLIVKRERRVARAAVSSGHWRPSNGRLRRDADAGPGSVSAASGKTLPGAGA